MALAIPGYYSAQVNAQALAYGVPPGLLGSILGAESGYNSSAFNPRSGASGIAQVLPSTAADPGYGVAPVNPWNPQDSIRFAAQYLRAMFDRLGNWSDAALAYNKGLGYAINNRGEVPYRGNGPIYSSLSNAAGISGTTTGSAPASGAAGNASTASIGTDNGCSSWVSTPGACISNIVRQAGYVVLGIVILAAGLWLLAK